MTYQNTILIVDDLPTGREVLEGLLTGQGYKLAFAGDGQEALTLAAALTPDLILLDVMMPDMDGFEVCRRLRADPLLADVSVIMITALDDTSSLLQGIEAGADDFISKPFNSTELQARVRTITRLNRYRRLLSARTKFDWVVEKSTDGYLVVDNDDNILYANPQARVYLDLPPDPNEPISATFLELASQHFYYEPEEAWGFWPQELPAEHRHLRYLVRPESDAANAFWLQVNVLELPSSSDEGWIVQLSDVTARITLERDMWEFQTMVSHKLRTPMVSLFTGLHLLKLEMPELSNEQAANLFDIVLRGAERLHRDVENVLRYLHTSDLVESGDGLKLADLPSLLDKISSDLGLEPAHLSLDQALDEIRLKLHPQAVELVLWELFENAKKFHPRQTPTIEVSISACPVDNRVSIQISDDGVRLPPEQLAQILAPYYQVDKYFTGEVAGMGLGLSRVALFIWSVGGKCRIANRTDTAGVIVELILPLDETGQDDSGDND